ncbi:PfkB family carbohydrate kinase [Bifidobacterium eulemuris]|uniref:Kinase, PfkB family n=1 Tax=Bifidobacterium eulemuris TaxID=1765219 RepID=A0A261GAZ9_9BIFI|nr:PfkB family carbohydrate kinase [Bifidobacterium eulemuris]OZG68146.1 Kinase, PfkB family [Bifidobacterium eulemuris]QOL31790.1 hypothetical protein BE0216_04405 [Bifidobacterium eulemuris]
MSDPTVISLGQIIVDMTMRVEQVPRAGEDVFAQDVSTQVGASYNMLHAVRQMGVSACHGAVLGTGAWSDLIARTLHADGIDHIGVRVEDEDCGFCIALTDAQAERTFVSTRGAEAHAPLDAFDGIEPNDGDVVYISGYTLVHRTAQALLRFLTRTRSHRFTAIFDVSPMLEQVDDVLLDALVGYRPIWSCNEREADIVVRRLRLPDSLPDRRERYASLADALDAIVIVRTGAEGAWVCRPDGECELVDGFPVTPVDTNGAGDCHTGVLCAQLAQGEPLSHAVRIANAAASIAVTRRGPATCPTRDETEQLMRSPYDKANTSGHTKGVQ